MPIDDAVAGEFRVLVAGSALCSQAAPLRSVLEEFQDLQLDLARPLTVVVDDFPAGPGEIALGLCLDLGVHSEIIEPRNIQEGLNAEDRWAAILHRTPIDVVILGWHKEPRPVEAVRQAAARYDIPIHEYIEVPDAP